MASHHKKESPSTTLFKIITTLSCTILVLSSSSSSSSVEQCYSNEETTNCNNDGDEELDPNLKPLMPFTVNGGKGGDLFLAYESRDVSNFYGKSKGKMVAKRPYFQGLAGKFINLSVSRLSLYWDPANGRQPSFIADAHPFQPVGTATFPTHQFIFTAHRNPTDIKIRFQIDSNTSLYIYDPIQHQEEQLDTLTEHQKFLYDEQKLNLQFAIEYRRVTGRDWLGFYPKRKRPLHKMWSADRFGQEHYVVTEEVHFTSLPPSELLGYVKERGSQRRRLQNSTLPLQEYRSSSSTDHHHLNLTLKVLSCSPRVFEIQNFLSETEAHHVLELASGVQLDPSTTSGGSDSVGTSDTDTRTSRNGWVSRETSPIVDSIYRRASDILRIDESLLRKRSNDEPQPEIFDKFRGKISEPLQLVHYDIGQQYTPHHDWKSPLATNKHQSARFATLLLYLNDDMKGGETAFPRWLNAETGDSLKVIPKKGKAILFYSLLPDGNMDDLSQHSAMPVLQGEKWLMNLWVWDPIM